MNDKTLERILYVTGIATMLPVLQFVLPALVLRLLGMTVAEDTCLFFAQQWGLLVFCIGGLLVHAARHPVHRVPVMFAATLEKAGLVVTIAMNLDNPELRGLHLAAVFDGACVVLYSAYLVRRSA